MKILMLASSLDEGGAETHVFTLACALARLGHSVCVISSGGRLSQGLAWNNVRHIKLSLSSRNPFAIFKATLRLRKIIKRGEYDIIHIHSRLAGFICRISLPSHHPTVVSTVHSRFKINPILKKLSFWGARSIAVSEDLRDYLSSNYDISTDNITLIPNGIDTKKFYAGKKRSDSTKRRIVFVSRMDTDCSLCASLLVRLAPRLARSFDGIEIELVGGGNAFDKILELASLANRTCGYECVHLCGYVRNVAEHLRRADVFVGVSRAALEAMSCGIPTILAGNEGYIGLIDSSKLSIATQTNFCCRDSELPTSSALFEDICTLLEMTDEQRAVLGAHLSKYAQQNHSIDKLAKCTESFYESAIKSTPAKSADTLLCGYYGFSNLGDDALLSRAIARCREKGYRPCVICKSKRRTSRQFGVLCISRTNPFAILAQMRKSRRLIFGGGSILQNATSERSLIYYCSLIYLARKLSLSVELWANGLGPFHTKFGKRLASGALRSCDLIGLRDQGSAKLAISLGAHKNKIMIEDDLAIDIPKCDESRRYYLCGKLSLPSKKYSLIAVSGHTKRKLQKKILSELKLLLGAGCITPVFVPMHKKADLAISKRLAKKCGGIVCDALSASELRALLPHACFALGNRFHLLYLAKLEGIPIYPFGNDPKILELM